MGFRGVQTRLGRWARGGRGLQRPQKQPGSPSAPEAGVDRKVSLRVHTNTHTHTLPLKALKHGHTPGNKQSVPCLPPPCRRPQRDLITLALPNRLKRALTCAWYHSREPIFRTLQGEERRPVSHRHMQMPHARGSSPLQPTEGKPKPRNHQGR